MSLALTTDLGAAETSHTSQSFTLKNRERCCESIPTSFSLGQKDHVYL